MTREEAVKKLAKAGSLSVDHAEDLYDSIIPKPVVPQYVADWYEGNNGDLNGALFTMVRIWDEKSRNSDFYRWFRKNKEAFQTLVNMHQFGYEVEKEKRYTVRIRNLNVKNRFLVYDNFEGTWEFNPRYISNESYRVYHTREEIESDGFGWVFDCDGVEVKEVE
ncbi:DUF1642 domain-containing protein [Streptococcus thermophilus]|uniref:DUF1642 domain-containing protein n=1 Tax=Streptococcus thermophilus TaxID=1308 RepID=UPI003A807470